ncbi:MAG: hypothetical protein VB120_06140 [Lachnospiraceae bacterium]|nr:hypothetical protein [Lachnospiraceae bacterium]
MFIILFFAIFAQYATSDIKPNKTAEKELTGLFSGTSGSLIFSEGKKVSVSLSDDFVYILNGRANNQTYGYVFILGNEEISYERAEAFYLNDGSVVFSMVSCTTEKDKITFLLEDKKKPFLKEQRIDTQY